MEVAYWPTQAEVLKVVPWEMIETNENGFTKPQTFEISDFLPCEIMDHEREVAP